MIGQGVTEVGDVPGRIPSRFRRLVLLECRKVRVDVYSQEKDGSEMFLMPQVRGEVGWGSGRPANRSPRESPRLGRICLQLVPRETASVHTVSNRS